MSADLEAAIAQAWEDRASVTPASTAVREPVEADAHAALVHRAVMPPAEEHEVAEPGLAAVGPVAHMVGVQEKLVGAPGPAATAVPRPQRPVRGSSG